MHVKFEVLGAISIYRQKNLEGDVTLAMPLFEKCLRGHVRTVPGKMHVKFEVRSLLALTVLNWSD